MARGAHCVGRWPACRALGGRRIICIPLCGALAPMRCRRLCSPSAALWSSAVSPSRPPSCAPSWRPPPLKRPPDPPLCSSSCVLLCRIAPSDYLRLYWLLSQLSNQINRRPDRPLNGSCSLAWRIFPLKKFCSCGVCRPLSLDVIAAPLESSWAGDVIWEVTGMTPSRQSSL
jgi:hypothetical protein